MPATSTRHRSIRYALLACALLTTQVVAIAGFASPASAVAALSIEPISWDVIGLDSNGPETGPSVFAPAARVCNDGPDAATNVTATFVWTSANAAIEITGPMSVTHEALEFEECRDFYFEVTVDPVAASFNTARSYQIVATAESDPLVSVSTPLNRELFVEKLVSQNRNSVTVVTGETSPVVGGTYTYTVTGKTATNGYEQLAHVMSFPSSIFEVQSVYAEYDVPGDTDLTGNPIPSTNDSTYADACGWDPDSSHVAPNPIDTYHSCIGPEGYAGGKVGGSPINVYFTVKVIGSGPATLSPVIYDFSGSSFHYNSDFGTTVLSVNAVDPLDLGITKTDSVDPVVPGATLGYTLVATNGSTQDATGVTVTDTLPAGVTFLSASASNGGLCEESLGVVSCALGPVSAGTAVNVTINVTVDTDASGTLSNTATVSAAETDANALNDSATETTTIEAADIEVAKVIDNASPDEGDPVAYTLTVTNNGPSPATGVEVTESLPSGVSYVGDDSGGAYSGGVWSVGSLAVGASAELTIDALVGAGTAGDTITNTATRSASSPVDHVSSNDSASAPLTVGVGASPPVANNDSTSTDEDSPVTFLVTGNDTDVDGDLDPTTATVATDPANGVAVSNANGTFTYTPDANFSGEDSFTYQVCDAGGLCDTATVTITVDPISDPPVANDDSTTTDEDTAVTFLVTSNDTDPDGDLDPTTAALATDPANGVAVSNGDGTFTYTPDLNFNGDDSFTYQICDLLGACDTATVSVTVDPIADPPVAVNDAATTDEDVAVVVDLAGNDTDPDGDLDPTSVTVTVAPSNGSITNHADGTVTYTPNLNYNGSDSFTYQVCDLLGACDTAVATLTIDPLPDPPVANDDSVSTDEDTAVTFLATFNDTDPDSDLDPTTATVATVASYGTAVSNGDGTFTYTPNLDYAGPDSFTYQVCDALGACDTATVSITVDPIADPPVAVDDSATTDEDTAVLIDLAGDDTDPDGDLDPTSVTVTVAPTNGSITNHVDGTVTYTPNLNYAGSDSFTYEVCDVLGACDIAVVTVTVNSIDDPPVANDDAASVDEDSSVVVNVTSNDSDVDGNLDPTTATVTSGPTDGALVNHADGTFTYTPDADFHGDDSFTYQVCDTDNLCDTAVVSITVDPVNDPPVANPDSETTNEDTPVTFSVTGNDTDIDGNLLATSTSLASAPTNGVAVRNANGTFTYTPNTHFNGSDSFDYEVCDSGGLCDTATVTITINPVNDPPMAVNDGVTTDEDTAVTIDATSNDSDVDGNLDPTTTTVVSGPTDGTVVNNADGTFEYTPDLDFTGSDSFIYRVCDTGGLCADATVTVTVDPIPDAPVAVDDSETTLEDTPVIVPVSTNDTDVDGNLLASSATALTVPSNGSTSDNADGTITYTPDADFFGTDSFTYEICDAGGLCDQATVVVTVTGVPDPPVANDDAASTQELAAVDIDVAANDVDVDGDLNPASATVVTGPTDGTLTNNGDGTFTYLPDFAFSGPDSFAYEICDDLGSCDTATVSIVVSPNNVPVANVDSVTTLEDTAVAIDVVANDTDADGNLDPTTTSIVSPADHGVLVNNGDGTFGYTPDANYEGPDSFTYEVCDTSGACDTAIVSITVSPVNDPPVAVDDAATTDEGVAVVVSAASNDLDVDGNLNPSSASVVNGAANGTVVSNGDGTFTYTPTGDFNGDDSFTYSVCDTGGLCDWATVAITVDPVNDAPVAADDAVSTDEDVTVDFLATFNDTDVDGNLDPTTASVVSGPSNGSLVNNGDGTFSYTPAENFNGDDSFTYSVCDTAGLCDLATVSITVDPANDPPVAVDDSVTTDEDTLVVISATSNDTDIDLNVDPATAAVVTGPSNGSVVNNGDGTFSYTPAENFNGDDSFTYSVCDTAGLCDVATVSITVDPVNDAPVAVDDSATTDEDTLVVISATSNDTDVDLNLDPTTASVVTGPSNGSVVNNGDGTFSYTPAENFNGDDSFTYSVCDTGGLCDVATVSITVDPVNDAPVAVDDSATTDEDTLVVIDVASNDTDVDLNLDPTTASVVTGPSNGSVVNNGDGTFSYTPAENFNGDDSFTYSVCDTDGLCDVATVSITVNPVNDPPDAADDASTTNEDTLVIISATSNDTDIDLNLDPTTAAVLTGPSNGTVVNNGDGTFSYTPAENLNGDDSFTYSVCDTGGLCDVATVSITVDPVNDAPVAVDDSATTDEDTLVVIDVASNDTDVDLNLDPTTASVVTGPSNGSVVNNGDGTFSYTPAENFNGDDSFTYSVCDTDGLCDVATVSITVNPINDPPDAADDASTTNEDTLVIISATSNDTDIDLNLDPTTAAVLTGPSNGTVVNNGDGTFSYTPAENFNGDDSFTYSVCDTGGLCDVATVSITVDPVNDAPVAVDDSATTDEDTLVVISATSNDTDVEDNIDPTTASVVTGPSNGTVVNNGDGTFSYTPAENFNGDDSFTYSVCDTDGLCDVATVSITVNPINDPPDAADDASTTNEDTLVIISATSNDTDIDLNLDPTTAAVLTGPSNGTVVNNGDGTFSYTPAENFNGDDSFTYSVCDTGGLCDIATVSITVNPVNDPPVAVGDAATTDEDEPVTVLVTFNDSDVDGNLDPATTVVSSAPTNGSVTNNGDGTLTYVPNANYSGTDSFQYIVCDTASACASATVTVTVDPVNDAPIARDDSASTSEDVSVVVNATANDTDVDGDLDPSTATVTTAPANGTVTNNSDGTFTYLPDPNFNGSDSFTYEVCDAGALCDTAIVTITVASVNDAPVAEDDAASTPEDTVVSIPATANDLDVDGNLLPATATVLSGPANGSLTNNGDGSFSYLPDSNFNGSDSFTYEVCDAGALCDTATVVITVDPVNDAPVAVDDATSTNEDTPVTFGVLANDLDVDGDLVPSTTAVTGAPTNGTLTNHGDGTFTYTPDLNYSGSDSFTYEVCDSNGACDSALVSIGIGLVNDPPVATDDAATTDEDLTVVIDVAANDSDVDGNLVPGSATATTLPANGSLVNNGDGTFSYTPNANFSGSDSFSYEVCDAGGLCDTATVDITVNPINDPPVAVDDAIATDEDTPVTVAVTANDTDLDDGLDLTSAVMTSAPSNGIVTNNGDGTFTYTPTGNFNGADSFSYEICDLSGACDTASVTISVIAINDSPVAVDDSATTSEDTPVQIAATANDSDPDGDLVASSASVVSGPANGSVVNNGDGTFEYIPNDNFNGSDSFVYEVCDGSGSCASATVTVTVDSINDAPVATDDAVSTPEDSSVLIAAASNDTDVDGDLVPSSAVVTVGPASGTVTNNGDGTFSYLPSANYFGNDSFTYEVCDSFGVCDTATVSISVTPVDDPPVASNELVSTDEDAAVVVDATANDIDVDGDLNPASAVVISGPIYGTVTNNGDGTFVYTPGPHYNGPDSFTYEVCDLAGNCDRATVTLAVAAVNDAPVAADDSASTPEDTATTIDVIANDVDVEGELDPTSVSIAVPPTSGTVVVNGDGTVTYTPDADFNGSDSFTYVVCDLDGACDEATVVIEVDSVPDAPVASDDSEALIEDTSVVIDATANDSDVDGDLVVGTSSVTSGPANGSVTNHGDGTFTYTPDLNFNGTDSFTYEVCDASGLCDDATVTLTVAGSNDPPLAGDDAATTSEDTAVVVNVATNDHDIDGNLDVTTTDVISGPTNGTVTNNGDGSLTYVPNPNYNGPDTFVYEVCDTAGACDQATVSISVDPVADAPVAVNDAAATDEDTLVTIDVAANDVDVDGDLDPTTAIVTTPPAFGSLANNGDGTFDYLPGANFYGQDSFTYEICDSTGLCASATVAIDVAPVNDAPIAIDDVASGPEDTRVVINAVTNDVDVDGNLDLASLTVVTPPANGTVTPNGDGTFTYMPNEHYNGPDVFTYEVCDTDGLCDTATITISIAEVNDPPVAVDDVATVDEDVATVISVTGNDSDVDGNLDPSTVSVLIAPSHGTVTPNGDGTVTYVPLPEYSGPDSFTYQVCDTSGICDTAVVTIDVLPVNDPPAAADDSATVNEDESVVIDVLVNDTDIDGPIDPDSVRVVGAPTSGTVTINPDGTVLYTPNADFNGTDSFSYEACDFAGGCAIATVTVDVAPVADPPVTADDTVTVAEDGSVVINVIGNDSDPDDDIDPATLTIVSPPTNGTLVDNGGGTVTYTPAPNFSGTDQFTYEICDTEGSCSQATVLIEVPNTPDPPIANDVSGTAGAGGSLHIQVIDNDVDPDGDLDGSQVTITSVPSNGSAVSDGQGGITYTPRLGFSGTDSFTYQVCDSSGLCDTATVTFTVTANNPPTILTTPQTRGGEAGISVSVGEKIPALGLTDPEGGPVTVQVVGGALPPGVTLLPNGEFAGTPTVNGIFDFLVEACDEAGLCTIEALRITVNAMPLTPTPQAAPDPQRETAQLPVTGMTTRRITLWGAVLLAWGLMLLAGSRVRRRTYRTRTQVLGG